MPPFVLPSKNSLYLTTISLIRTSLVLSEKSNSAPYLPFTVDSMSYLSPMISMSLYPAPLFVNVIRSQPLLFMFLAMDKMS